MGTSSFQDIALGHTITTTATKNFEIHCHYIYEIYYFIEGDVEYIVEGSHYKPAPHSLLLLAPHVLHGVKINTERPYHRYTLHFDPACLHLEGRDVLLSSLPDAKKRTDKEIFFDHAESYHLEYLFRALENCKYFSNEVSSVLSLSYLEALLAQITVLSYDRKPIKTSWSASSHIAAVIQYLNTHLTDAVSLTFLSEKFGISKHYLNRAFKKAVGTTVMDYVIYKRVVYAKQLLLRGYSAGEACTRSGFLEYSSFFRAYKRIIGHPPVKDRQEGSILQADGYPGNAYEPLP